MFFELDPTLVWVKLGVFLAGLLMGLLAYREMGDDRVGLSDTILCLGGLYLGAYQCMSDPSSIARMLYTIPLVFIGAYIVMPSAIEQMTGKTNAQLAHAARKYVCEAGVFLYIPVVFFVLLAR